MIAVDKHFKIKGCPLFDLCRCVNSLYHYLRFIAWINRHRVNLYTEVFPTQSSVNSIPLCFNTIRYQDNPFVCIRGENTPCRFNCSCDIRSVANILILIQPSFLDFSEFKFPFRLFLILNIRVFKNFGFFSKGYNTGFLIPIT